jgi:hypothetical protein
MSGGWTAGRWAARASSNTSTQIIWAAIDGLTRQSGVDRTAREFRPDTHRVHAGHRDLGTTSIPA